MRACQQACGILVKTDVPRQNPGTVINDRPMPRKFWKQKNRYCWNTNLSEDIFRALLKLYCTGYSCSDAARIIERYARRYAFKKVSRQTANRYYLLFGDYLYAMLPEPYKFADIELEESEGGPGNTKYPENYDRQLIIMSLHQALYEKLDRKDKINKTLIGVKTQDIHKLLQTLSRSKRGIPITAFSAHYSLCFWLLLIQGIRPDESPSKALFHYLIETMEEFPIGTFEMASIRIVRAR